MRDRYTMTFPDYTVGVEAYEKIREVCPRYGKTVVVIGGRRGVEAAQEKIIAATEGVGLEFTGFLHAGGETSYENITKLSRDQAVMEADMVFAVGGGKAIDTAKVVASELRKPYFAFPTVAGSCAAISGIATIYTPEGRFQEYARRRVTPVHSFLCSRIMAQAPVCFLLRGISDTIAKYYEAQISSRGKTLCHTDAMGLAVSRLCADPVYAYGVQAVQDNKRGLVSNAFEEVMLSVVVSSGMVSNFAAPEFNGHIAHTLYEELSALPRSEQSETHGGLAAYGTLLLLLADGQREEFERLHAFCQQIGLPVSRKAIGATEEEIHRVFQATEEHQDVKILPYKITQDMLRGAAEELEDYNKGARK